MANDIYQFTLDGLTSLVSPRAAEQLLLQTLRRAGTTPESVEPETMRELLLGPLRRNLAATLPPDAVERRLRQLGRQVMQRYASPPPSTPLDDPPPQPSPTRAVSPAAPTPEPAREPVASRLSAAPGLTPTPVPALTPSPPPPAEADAATLAPAVPLEPVPEAAPAPTAAPSLAPTLDPAQLEAAALRLAELEQVRLVAVLSPRGEVRFSRGSGLELEALSRLASLAWLLLGRQGELRSVYLAQPAGQFFLFALGGALLAVVGGKEINVGQVFTTIGTLKEDV